MLLYETYNIFGRILDPENDYSILHSISISLHSAYHPKQTFNHRQHLDAVLSIPSVTCKLWAAGTNLRVKNLFFTLGAATVISKRKRVCVDGISNAGRACVDGSRNANTFLQIFLVPVNRKVNTLRKVIFRVISEELTCLGDVRIGVADIACAVGTEVRLHILAQRLAQIMVNIN